jgi:hypothetical protein
VTTGIAATTPILRSSARRETTGLTLLSVSGSSSPARSNCVSACCTISSAADALPSRCRVATISTTVVVPSHISQMRAATGFSAWTVLLVHS